MGNAVKLKLSGAVSALFAVSVICAGCMSGSERVVSLKNPENYKTYIEAAQKSGRMMYSDDESGVVAFAKDPCVINFGGKYFMYYTAIPADRSKGVNIVTAVAVSDNLKDWKKVGEVRPFAQRIAPFAIVIDSKVHLFYQAGENRAKNKFHAICHAVSEDGVNFTEDPTNPIFAPDGDWNNGRAIDAEVCKFKGRWFLYFATRDKSRKFQMQGVAATADDKPDFSRSRWEHLSKKAPVLKSKLPWETFCIEAASTIVRDGKIYMFYAGGYNMDPQQIGVAVSEDGVNFTRLFDKPFLPNGAAGEWNSSESGHPAIFEDKTDGKTYLFYQGNCAVKEKGRIPPWFLSNVEIGWKDGKPFIAGGEK